MKVPISLAHDYTKIIGELIINEELLPKHTDWVLAPGYLFQEGGTYQLIELGLIHTDFLNL